MTSPRWKRRPHGSTWGDFGPDDERGRLNLITPEKVRQGVAEVREGLTFCLSLPLEYPGGNVLNPRRHPPVVRPTHERHAPELQLPGSARRCRTRPTSSATTSSSCTCNTRRSGTASPMSGSSSTPTATAARRRSTTTASGPARTWSGRRTAPRPGCRRGLGARTSSQARRLGVHRMAEACMQGRGVMIDLHAHVGRERVVVGYDRLMRVIEADKVAVEEGDMVCLHTGFGALLLEMGGTPDPAVVNNACAVLDGRDAEAPAAGSPTQGSPASSPTTTPSRPIRRSPARAAARRCRCTSTACSASASTSASSGT